MRKKAILAGGSGFVGRALACALARDNWEVVILTRNPESCHLLYDKRLGETGVLRGIKWDGRTVETGWMSELEGAEVVVNFTGKSVQCVHNEKNKAEIVASRVDSVQALGEAMKRCRRLPKVWVQCSAVGYYGNQGLPVCDETGGVGTTFLADVCAHWERTFEAVRPQSVRPVVFRLAMVLGKDGGAFPPLAKVARLGLGGRAGDGRQGVSWVHIDDLVAMFVWAIKDPAMRGTLNACAPEPISNDDFMRTLRSVLRRPWSPPVPRWMLKIVAPVVMRTDPSILLEGQFCVPAALQRAGFEFTHPKLAGALGDLVVVK